MGWGKRLLSVTDFSGREVSMEALMIVLQRSKCRYVVRVCDSLLGAFGRRLLIFIPILGPNFKHTLPE